MASAIKNLVLGLIGSKKFVVFVSGSIAAYLLKYKINVDPVLVEGFIAALVAYLLGQGLADVGKEAAKVKPAQVEATTLKPTT